MEIKNKDINIDIKNKKLLKLNLGSGPKNLNYKKNYYSVDHLDLNGVDIISDLNKPFNLLPDNCTQSIYSSHVFEHIENLDNLLNEIHRITIPKGNIEIIVPHFSNPYYYSDPTHTRFFGLYSMYYYVDQKDQPKIRKVPDFYSKNKFIVNKIQYDFFSRDFFDRLINPLLFWLVNKNIYSQDFYERHFSGIISARQIHYFMTPVK